jgi:hypothetical protein
LKIASVAEAGDEAVTPAPEAAEREADLPAQFVGVMAAAVLEFTALAQVPNACVWIEFRHIGGQPF